MQSWKTTTTKKHTQNSHTYVHKRNRVRFHLYQYEYVHCAYRCNNINTKKKEWKMESGTYSRSASNGMRRGTCCKSRCEQSTVWPVHVQTRGHFWSMLLLPSPPPIAVFAKFVPCTKMPTLPTLLNVPNDESPFPYGINCNSKITKLVVVAFTTQLSGGFFIFDIISHIYVDCCCSLQLSFVYEFDDVRSLVCWMQITNAHTQFLCLVLNSSRRQKFPF